MTSPSLNDYFSDAYDALALYHKELPIFEGCYHYQPENYDDYHCLSVWQPAPELGARIWTRGGKRILIGVYKDQGRPPARQPLTPFQWSRVGSVLAGFTVKPHRMQVGDLVDLANVNVPSLENATVLEVQTPTQFKVSTAATGGTSGLSGLYSPKRTVIFDEEYVVFRLLPSYKIVPISTVLAILAQAKPRKFTLQRSLNDITTGGIVKVAESEKLTQQEADERLHRQQIDELRKPLGISYDAKGKPIMPDMRFTRFDNAKAYKDGQVVNQHNPALNTKLHLFDYYGFELNDINRGSNFTEELLYYSAEAASGIKIMLDDNQQPRYKGPVHDRFGNYVIGALPDLTLMTRRPIQPLAFDQHYTPYAEPKGQA